MFKENPAMYMDKSIFPNLISSITLRLVIRLLLPKKEELMLKIKESLSFLPISSLLCYDTFWECPKAYFL